MTSTDLFSDDRRPAIDRSLIAYAFLAQATHTAGDLLSGLAPIFKPIAKLKIGKKFDAVEFSALAKTFYGIDIHPWAVDDLAPRLEKAGLLLKNGVSRVGAEYIYADVQGEFNDVRESDIKHVVEKFIRFSRPILDKNQISFDEKSLEDAFFSQLTSMDFHSILLKPDRSNTGKKADSGKTLALEPKREKLEWEKQVNSQSKIDVLCASFIIESFSNDRPLYDLIVRIATGAMVAETVLNFQDPRSTDNLNTLKVFLDAPFLMSLLDLTGEQSTEYARSLCNQLLNKGATIYVFRHSVEELGSNLRGALNGVEQGTGFGATARRLVNSAFRQYVISILADVEGAVSRHGYKIANVPASPDVYQFLSAADEENLGTALGCYDNALAKERDAASVAAIIRLQRGKRTRRANFHQAQYIFVTDNMRVAERSNSFTRQKNLRGEGDVPPAITDRYLAGMLFVLFGGKATELTHYRLLANCAAALEPRTDVITKIHSFLSQLDESKALHFRVLMTDERASQHMMQLTLGDAVLVSSTQNAEQIFEQIENKLSEKFKKEYEVKMGQIENAHEAEIARLKSTQEGLREEVRSSGASVIQIKDELKRLQAGSDTLLQVLVDQQSGRLEEKRVLIGRCVEHGARAAEFRHGLITLGLVVTTVLVAYMGTNFANMSSLMKAAILIGSGVLAAFGFWKNPDKIFGKHLDGVKTKAFQSKATEYQVFADLDKYSIDWATGSVSTKPAIGQEASETENSPRIASLAES